MARADLLVELVRSGSQGNKPLFRKALEALIAEERAKQHHIFADRLTAFLRQNGSPPNGDAPTQARSPGAVEIQPTRRLEDLILPDAVRQACVELVEENQRADLLHAHGIEPRHRVLLQGPPGNGKTSLAEALATELMAPLFVVRYDAVIASYLGETAVRLARLFDDVRTRRCVLFFDEFDVIGKERGDPHETGEIKRVVSSLLLQVDGLPAHVTVITATNHPELLDRATWRRFQLRLLLPPPTGRQTAEWFRRLEQRLGGSLGVSTETLAKRFSGASYAELEDFGEEVHRRHVLALPEGEIRQIVQDRLKQWKATGRMPSRAK